MPAPPRRKNHREIVSGKNTCVMVKTPAENTIDAISLVVEK